MNMLAFFAHPDDETMLVGGVLSLLAQSGAQADYLCATRGEGGEVGEPPLCTIEELGKKREQEMVCAVQNLGGRSLTFLDYTDPRTGPDDALYPYSDDLTLLAGQIVAHIRQVGADVLITHGSNGEYGHPAHVFSHQAARMAVESMNGSQSTPLLYTVAADFPDHPKPRLANRDDQAHLIIDVTPSLSQKTSAAMCHETQHALFVRRSSQAAGRQMTVPEVIMRVESLHRASPVAKNKPEDELINTLRPWEQTV